LKSLNKSKKLIKPIFATIYIELKLQKVKFIIFSVITIILFIITGVIPYLSTPYFIISQTPADYFFVSTNFYLFMVIISISVFFSGIICSEYQKNTGLTILPLVSKSQLIIGKYIANSILVIGIGMIYFSSMAIFSYYLYGGPILYTIFISFGFLVLYLLALASITTFLSAFMPSILPVFATITSLVLFGGFVIDPVLRTLGTNLEPIYSVSYLFYIILFTFYPNFSSIERFRESSSTWLFPSAEDATLMLIIYSIGFFLLAYLLFRRRQL